MVSTGFVEGHALPLTIEAAHACASSSPRSPCCIVIIPSAENITKRMRKNAIYLDCAFCMRILLSLMIAHETGEWQEGCFRLKIMLPKSGRIDRKWVTVGLLRNAVLGKLTKILCLKQGKKIARFSKTSYCATRP